jgi:FkbM family methyltransferase
MPYGVDAIQDIRRLSAEMNIPIRTIFDVGANVGQTSQRALRAFPNAMVFAFEPSPQTFAVLSRLSHPNFCPHNIAFSDHNAATTLFCNGTTRDSLVFADADAPGIIVNCRTLDAFCKDKHIKAIDVLKTDTEGNDLAVLRGASQLLHHTRFVCAEFFYLQPSNLVGTTLNEIVELLDPYGFQFVATYTERVIATGGFFVISDALFVRPL